MMFSKDSAAGLPVEEAGRRPHVRRTMTPLKILIVHGIGNCKAGYSSALQKGLAKEFASELGRILGSRPAGDDQLVFHEAVWEEVLAASEGKLKAILEKEFNQRRRRDIYRLLRDTGLIIVLLAVLKFFFVHLLVAALILTAIVFFVSHIAQVLYKLRTAFAAESICDIVAYRNKINYREIHNCLQEGIRRLCTRAGATTAPEAVTFIAHSLGTVIVSDFIYDAQEGLNNRSKDFRCVNFFTLGSPLTLFSLQCGPDGFSKPITIEDENGRWVNILDPDDPIGYKLKGLNDAYDKAVAADCEINTGGFGISHLKYWDNRMVQRMMARKLAIDWASTNGLIDKEKSIALYRAYDAEINAA
jgi:hypothetical protein